ncbi:methyl-accepting chemotaxis protein [Methanospirillum lacunae]|uniref:methyl-accepting chemotaxis protein n=1 Tax=Methanospirillum lacunae TaxID=668570 RepID=UPI0015E858A6|nr:methyl-accepting chemotaxis protein [Methanospirillum lacunae]
MNSIPLREQSIQNKTDTLISHPTITTTDSKTLQNILDYTPVAIQIVGPEGMFIDCNRKTIEMFGAQVKEDIIGRPPGILSPPIQRNGKSSSVLSHEMIIRAFSGEIVNFRWDHQKISGEIFPANVTLNQIQYEGRTCLMATVIDQSDIVNRISAMSALIANAPFSILTISPQKEILHTNPAYCEVTGHTKEEANSIGFRDHKVLSREGGSIQDAIRLKQTVSGKFVCHFKSGIKHLDYTYIPVLNHNHDVVQIYHIMIDQTDLINRLNEFQLLIDKSPAGIITMDVNGTILSTNQAFSSISQIPIQTIISKNIRDFKIISRKGPMVSDVVRSGKPEKGELVIDFGSGQKILEYSYIPVLDTNNAVVRVITMYIDMTGVNRLVEYLEKSVQIVTENIGCIAEGKTTFTTSVLPADEYTKSTYENFVVIQKSLDKARLAISNLVDDFINISQEAASGHLSYRVDPSRHQGDYKTIIKGINTTLDSISLPLHEAMRLSKEFAAYNFTARFSSKHAIQGDWVSFQNALDHIGAEISSVLSHTLGNIHDLKKNTEEANASIEEITAGSGEVTSLMSVIQRKTEEGDSSTKQILNAMKDMVDVVGAVSMKADEVASLSQEATLSAKSGIELAHKSEHSMKAIASSSDHVGTIISDINVQMNEIGKIVKLISDIASQTNLLALNAAIEAARAGEAGRGFAVVASEVKSLAQDSRKSAETIADLITSLQQKSESAKDAMTESNQVVLEGRRSLEQTLQAFNEIAQKIENISSHITEVASSTEEQAASVEEVTSSIQEIADLTHIIRDETVSVSSTSQEISSALSQINKVVSNIVVIVDGVSDKMVRFQV